MMFTEVLTCILLARDYPWVTWSLNITHSLYINYTLSCYFPMLCHNGCHGGPLSRSPWFSKFQLFILACWSAQVLSEWTTYFNIHLKCEILHITCRFCNLFICLHCLLSFGHREMILLKSAGAVVTLCTECTNGIVQRYLSPWHWDFTMFKTRREMKYRYPQWNWRTQF